MVMDLPHAIHAPCPIRAREGETALAEGGRGGWTMAADRVMGGVSSGAMSTETIDGCPATHLRGRVSLENNGGFLLLDLPVRADARGARGVRLWVCGNGERYTLSLRTADTRRPTQFYDAPFTAGRQWAMVEIPFTAFRAVETLRPLDLATLRDVWVVAKGRAFDADVAVGRVALYR